MKVKDLAMRDFRNACKNVADAFGVDENGVVYAAETALSDILADSAPVQPEATAEPKPEKHNYLVTDPCYIMEGAIYHEFLDKTDGEVYEGEPFVIPGFGKILECDHSAEISLKVGKRADGTVKEILSDTALICLVELDDGVTPTDYNGTAVTARRDTADKWYRKAIELGTY